MGLTPEEIFRRLYLIRHVEEEICRVYPTDRIQSPVHLSIGQELASVAVCDALEPRDKVFGSYRSHALYLAKGGDLNAFVAELYGKVTGCARGKGGSMHMVAPEVGLLGTSAVVASLIPVAVGYAWAQKQQKTGVVTAVFFGDGATEEGCYFEALNFATLHDLPILFVCENNGYAIVTPVQARQPTTIYKRADAMGLDADATLTYGALYESTLFMAARAVQRVREIHRPVFLEIYSHRLKEHVGPAEDWHQGYRPRVDPNDDVIVEARRRISTGAEEKIVDQVRREVAAAFAFAEASAVPGPEELMAHTYG